MIIDEDDYLEHYGTPRHSGRYKWGSGGEHEESSHRHKDFLGNVQELRKKGLSDAEIATGMGIGTTDKDGNFKPSTTQLRAKITIANAERKQDQVTQAQKLHDKGLSNVAVGEKLGLPESSVRALLKPGAMDKANQLMAISDMLKDEVDKKKYVDVGSGVENHINVSKQRLDASLAILKEKGYNVHPVPSPQTGTGFETNMKILVPPGVTQNEAWQNRHQIQQLSQVSPDGGRTFGRINHPPMSIDPKRVDVKYGDEGGLQKDGVIYVRPGVDDISLGKARYAQVRVKVGDSHYLKGMAMYNDNLPAGTDLLFHTNKNKSDIGSNKLDAMKKLEDDPTLPFGTFIKNQITENTGTPNEKLTSAMNIVNEEGDWKKWNRNISAQALSKQSPSLARQQLDKTYKSRKDEYDDIMTLTNPAVRKKLLESFSDATDKSAVHLKAAALDRQNWHVILPIESMKPTEIYAPKYNNGERVVLIRYPHGGTFEIPELTVNNRHPEAKSLLKDAQDAVGIHHSVAEHLSGADFDGDTVLVIPNDRNIIKTSPALEALKNFDSKRLYKLPEGQKFSGNKQHLMGDVSNLITDMTIKGAPHEHIARAVKHSMVVIDAEKHDLDYKRSYIDNNIGDLKARYQGGGTNKRAGASTIISRAKSDKRGIPDRKARPYGQGGPINKETGALEFVPTGKMRRTKSGELVPKTITSKKLAEESDAHELVSEANMPMERLYADHSNKLKALANQARLSQINTPALKTSASAKKVYASQVATLNDKLRLAQRNSPRERQANTLANLAVSARIEANPSLKLPENRALLKKVRYEELDKARTRVGADKPLIDIEPKEWEAIQAGAISNSRLNDILKNADIEKVRMLATPRPERVMDSGKVARAQSMLDRGFTRAEVARQLGVSVSTLDLHTSGDAEEED